MDILLDADLHSERGPHPELGARADEAAGTDHGEMADESRLANLDAADEDLAAGEHHVGAQRRAVGDVGPLAELEQRQVPHPRVRVGREIGASPVAEQPEDEPAQERAAEHRMEHRLAVENRRPCRAVCQSRTVDGRRRIAWKAALDDSVRERAGEQASASDQREQVDQRSRRCEERSDARAGVEPQPGKHGCTGQPVQAKRK